MNKNTWILIIIGAFFLLIVVSVYVFIIMRSQQSLEKETQVISPPAQDGQEQQVSHKQKSDKTETKEISIENTPILEPTELTPVSPPASLEELQDMLATPMDYQSITIRYSEQRDTYIIYYAGDKEQAQADFADLLQNYEGVNIDDLTIEYENLESPLLERPPVTITLSSDQ